MATVKLLIKNGANVESITIDGYNLLHIAAEHCHYKIMSYLIQEHKISIHKTDSKGRTPLFRALVANKSISEDDLMATVQLLIKNGASVETITTNGYNLLHIAAEHCHYKIISYLIQEHKISIHKTDSKGRTPLFRALVANKSISQDDVMATVKLLIENGANVETITNDGHNLLHIAAEHCHYKIISYLIEEHNISIHKTDSKGRTPLFRALFANKSISQDDVMATVKLLIKYGASVETISNDGHNLLHVASEFWHHQIISYLVQEHTISIHKTDRAGSTPLFRALLANESISEDEVMTTVKELIKNGANVETTTNNGSSLLHVAAMYCCNQIISYLIQEHNLSVDTPDSSGQTPLFCALLANKSISQENVMATVKLLIENGASAETITNNGFGLLHAAAEYCCNQMISYLIQEHNISVDTPNPSGQTPLFHALFANKSIPEENVMATVKVLIQNGANVETITNNGSSLLHAAAEYCRNQIISYLIQEHNISVDTPDSAGQTPLFYALFANKSIPEEDVMATVKLLIENGASVETITNNGYSLLQAAAEYCRDQIISYLIQEHNMSVDTPNPAGQTPLFYTLFANKSIPEEDVMATVKVLIENGANAETITNYGSSLLHAAAEYCRNQIISYLIQEHNMSVDMPNPAGQTPLFFALFANKSIPEGDVMATVKLLIENGANVETITNNGSSLLHAAAMNCRNQIIPYLIQEHNISVDTPDSAGQTPLFYALFANKSIPEEDAMATVKLLIENGASAETITNEDCSLLHVAAMYCHDQIISYLIQEHNISVDTPNFPGLTPLFYALLARKSISEDDVMETFKLLIAHGATVEATDNTGCTILHYAAQCGRYQALTYLLHNYNININTKDEDGDTPLHCALIADESIDQETVKKIIEILLLKGASINLKNKKDQTALSLASAEVREFILKSYTKTSKTKIP
ncbi:Ankyrin 2 [Carabus blaptoides fortunei]